MVLNLAEINSDKSPIKPATNDSSQVSIPALIDSIITDAEARIRQETLPASSSIPQNFQLTDFDGFEILGDDLKQLEDHKEGDQELPNIEIDAIPPCAKKSHIIGFAALGILGGLIAVAAVIAIILLMIALSPIGL